MNRLSELAGMFLFLLIGMNTMIVVFSGAVGITTEATSIVPDENESAKIFDKSSSLGSVSLLDSLVKTISLPWDYGTALYDQFKIVGAMLFGYETVLNAMYLPERITSFVTIIARALVIVMLFVVGLQIISSLQGGGG